MSWTSQVPAEMLSNTVNSGGYHFTCLMVRHKAILVFEYREVVNVGCARLPVIRHDFLTNVLVFLLVESAGGERPNFLRLNRKDLT